MNAQELVKIAEMRGEFFLAEWYAGVKIKAVKRKKTENRGTIVNVKSHQCT